MIIEIGSRPYVALARPDETLFFSSQWPAAEEPQSLPTLRALWRALGRADVEMVVVHPSFSAPWSLRALHRAILSRRMLQGRSPLLRAFGPELVRWRRRPQVIVVEHEDIPVINRDNLFLLDRCDLFFKRELAADHWRVFTKTAHAHLPTPRFRLSPKQVRRMRKLRPISLGLPRTSRGLLPIPPRQKRVDVFFSGRVDGSSTLRARGLEELRALAAGGVTVDIPEGRLPLEAFYERCAAAHVVWSPEGYGWDCFRHYEAPACGATALINRTNLERYAPLREGEHALYYDPEPGGLTRALEAALADKDRLARIAAAGQAYVMAHHTIEALSAHVVEMGRATRRA